MLLNGMGNKQLIPPTRQYYASRTPRGESKPRDGWYGLHMFALSVSINTVNSAHISQGLFCAVIFGVIDS